jgi:hypothetical protein
MPASIIRSNDSSSRFRQQPDAISAAKGHRRRIQANLDRLEGNVQARRRTPCSGVDVNKHLFDKHLFDSAVPHAGLDGVILDLDIPGDRRRIADDVDVMAGLAVRYLKVEAGARGSSWPNAGIGKRQLLGAATRTAGFERGDRKQEAPQSTLCCRSP